jgi:pSer/pThr/pTyr-binding forkhead associated (FHA) protein
MQVILEIIDGPMTGRRFGFRGPLTVTVGRTERSDYVLEADPQISSLHLRFDCEEAVCMLRDMNSSNGTWVNDEPVRETEVNDGDRIRIGRTTLKVMIEGLPKPRAASRKSAKSRGPDAHETTANAMLETAADRPRRSRQPLPGATDPQSTPRPSEDIAAAEQPAPAILLRIETEIDRGRSIWIRTGQRVTIGRGQPSDIVISADEHLSSAHFSIQFDGTRCELSDLDSTNGVAVNGIAVHASELHDGDEILAGGTRFRVVEESRHLTP